ncbi:S1C family serine protease [Pseudohongiella sp.]|uniref:PDZ domain-containing protein n=1 Tax=marine sediment metagenome TaxID=412755 RepID=A0A0F9Z0Y7_9ZZZZ|nr:serine protease [Pseudohongiella sp.]HDZ09954.1 trypsin-like serine protease [Pseudohongiella sp.]HEA63732.1 trypsin-like serine protease [Pseudohongiella sp.]
MVAAGFAVTRWRYSLFAALAFCGVLTFSSAASAQITEEIREIESSIVKIYTTSAAPDYFTPWRLMTPSQSSGSGAVVAGNRILTNAHVVANASYVQVQKHNDPERYLAQVHFISHASDLALLEIEDPAFFDDTPALAIGDLPEPNTEVFVFGYPVGGRTLSVTKGILSRVEQQVYAHSGEYLLAGQIDAAINPGNSGGPVIVDGKIAGVVMQSVAGGRTEALGYFVPPDILRHMLTDASDGSYDGFPDLGFRSQDLESPAAKAAYGLQEEQSGVLVIKVFSNSPADGILQENDVVLSIDGVPIAGDSTISLSRTLQTNYKHAIDLKQIGDEVTLTLSRHGEVRTVTLTARRRQENYSLVRGEEFDAIPEYYIYGGILFVPLNMNLIKRWGADWTRSAPVNLLHARGEWSSPERREMVVALQVLAADVNLGYHDVRNWIVDTVNGHPVRDFYDFVRQLRDNQDEFVVFRGDSGFQLVVDHDQALSSETDILQRYRIPASYSEGLFQQPRLVAQ